MKNGDSCDAVRDEKLPASCFLLSLSTWFVFFVALRTCRILAEWPFRICVMASGSCRLQSYSRKAFPHSIPSVGPGADPDVEAVIPQVTVSYSPGGRLPLLSARPAVTFPAAEHHRPLAGRPTKLNCLMTEAHR